MQPSLVEDERDRQAVRELISRALGPDATLFDFYAWMNRRPVSWVVMGPDLGTLRVRPSYLPPGHASPSFLARHRLMLDLAAKLAEEVGRQQRDIANFTAQPVDIALRAEAAKGFIENDNPAKMRSRIAGVSALLRLITDHEATPPSPVRQLRRRRRADPDVAAIASQFAKLRDAVGEVFEAVDAGVDRVVLDVRASTLRRVVERFPFEYAAEGLYDEAFAMRVLPRAGRLPPTCSSRGARGFRPRASASPRRSTRIAARPRVPAEEGAAEKEAR